MDACGVAEEVLNGWFQWCCFCLLVSDYHIKNKETKSVLKSWFKGWNMMAADISQLNHVKGTSTQRIRSAQGEDVVLWHELLPLS